MKKEELQNKFDPQKNIIRFSGTVKLGQINFINCLPINYALAKLMNENFKFDIFNGAPSELNHRLCSGELDLAPISAFEFLQNQDKYELLGNLSVSSKTQAGSVLFLSQYPIQELKTINITDKSATSVVLLKIILANKYNLALEDLVFESFSSDENLDLSNKLLIGDEALLVDRSKYEYVLDLGAEWYSMTGLPMVFGVWAFNKKFLENANFVDNEKNIKSKKISPDKTIIFMQNNSKSIHADLKKVFAQAKEDGFNQYFPDVIIEAFKQTGISKSKLQEYFQNLDYGFSDSHQKSLSLFEEFLGKYSLLDSFRTIA